ncbi:hypothetical protein NC652_027197 [Populus alba x Populus x berolinensis]|nr:hypothetical protein NC652_027197 [Populus alba x Populus x berolinensis]
MARVHVSRLQPLARVAAHGRLCRIFRRRVWLTAVSDQADSCDSELVLRSSTLWNDQNLFLTTLKIRIYPKTLLFSDEQGSDTNCLWEKPLRFAGKGLVVVREGISTPNTPYLRNSAREQCWEASGAENQWRHVFPRATATGGRGFTRRRKKNTSTGAAGSTSSPHLSSPAFFRSVLFSPPFGSASLSADLFWSFACPPFSVSGTRRCDRRAAGGIFGIDGEEEIGEDREVVGLSVLLRRCWWSSAEGEDVVDGLEERRKGCPGAAVRPPLGEGDGSAEKMEIMAERERKMGKRAAVVGCGGGDYGGVGEAVLRRRKSQPGKGTTPVDGEEDQNQTRGFGGGWRQLRLSDLWLSSDGLVIWINVKNNRPFLFWKPPDVLTLKWNVDGSSKGKQGLQNDFVGLNFLVESDSASVLSWMNNSCSRPWKFHELFVKRGLELIGSLEYKFLQLEFSIVLSRGLCVDCYSVQDSLWIL